jgi:hypothetical protein
MSFRRFAAGAGLALLGVVAAVGIGVAANSISDDSVGLSAQPLSAGEPLAPAAATDTPRRRARTTPTETETTPAPPAAPAAPAGARGGVEAGGGDDGLDDNSGSGSGSSGSGSSGSGSDGDDSSGRGRGRGRGGDD